MNELAGSQEARTIPSTAPLLAKLPQKRTAWILWIATLVVAAVTVVFAVLSRAEPRPEWHPWWLMVIEAVTGLLFTLPGLVVSTRQPRNPAGWLLLLAGLGSAVDLLAHAYGLYAIPRGLLGGVLAAWVSNWSFVLFIFPVFFLFLLFPNGQLPSGRWRIPAWYVGGCGVLVLLIAAFLPGPLGGGEYFPSTPNPVGLPALSVALENVGVVSILINLTPFLLSAASLLFRFRGSADVMRQQLKWVAWAVMTTVLLVTVHITMLDGPAESIAMDLVPVVLSASIAIAIVRHNLFDIDRILSRSLLYAGLTGVVVGLYIGSVSLFGLVLQHSASGMAPLLATGVVAVALQPLRSLLHRVVSRLVYGLRDDPYAALAQLGRRLGATNDPKNVLPQAAATVAEVMRLPYVAIELDDATAPDAGSARVAAHGTESPVALRLMLAHQGEEIGTLLVGARAPGEVLSAADLRLLRDVARHIAQAAAGVRLSLALLRSQEHAVAVRAEERRRLARDLHDGVGPVLTGATWTLQAATAQLRTNPDATCDLLNTALVHIRQGAQDLRRISMGLRSPVDQLGLREAVLAYTDRVSLAVHTDLPQHIPRLAAAVEEATYWVLVEAVANVLRHAQAANCWVSLEVGDDALQMTVADDGQGLPARIRPGVGVGSMRERAAEIGGSCEIRPRNGGGTEVVAYLPVSVPGAEDTVLAEPSRSV
ncbi:histidine kinase [Streptomyces sp. NBC_00885]|uniref:sensor histidine kinase n=1 Tax=Streptomyces sp. NBC_00885 TaxID=2975857 RepID=UPI00386F687E|nr:histidine kinase [Streptomyces sp. NBC_00885]